MDDIAWLWGHSWGQHALFILAALVMIGGLLAGWTEADNALRLNRKLRREEKGEH